MYKLCTLTKKSVTILLFIGFLIWSPIYGIAQQKSALDKIVTIELAEMSLADALSALGDQSGLKFSYSSTQLDVQRKVKLSATQKSVRQVLTELLGKQLKSLSLKADVVTIQTSAGKGNIKGSVKTSDGKPAPFVTVSIKDVKSTQADEKGDFMLRDVEAGNYRLDASYVGMTTQSSQIKVLAGVTITENFRLAANSQELTEIEVNGKMVNKFVVRKTETVAKLPLKNLENPQVYTTITRSLLNEQITTDLTDVLKNTPGILKMQGSIGRSGDGAVYYNLRGFPTRISMVDGIAGQTNGDIDPANIEKIEILKGPSGTLFGGALTTFGGLINVITKKPLDTLGGEIGYTTGNFNLNRLTADIYGPLNDDKSLQFRVNAAYHKRSSFQDAGFRKSTFVAPVISYRINEKMEAILNAEFYDYEGTNPSIVFLHRTRSYIATTPKALNYDWNRSFTSNDITLKAPASNIHGQLNYQISGNWKSQTSVSRNTRKTDGMYQYQFIRGASSDELVERNVQLQNYEGNYTALQQNFNGDFKIGGMRHRMVVGLDYLNQTTYNNNSAIVKFDTVSAVNGDLPAKYGTLTRAKAEAKIAALTGVGTAGAVVKNYNSSNIYSAYASDAIDLTDQLLVLLSLRVDRFQSLGTMNLATNTLLVNTKYSQTALSPKFGLVYQLIKDKVSVFGNYMNSFSNVPPVAQPLGDISGTFKPQQANQFEGGLKMDLFGNRMSFTASYYDIEVKDITRDEVLNREGIDYNIVVQNGTQRSKGFEFELIANPVTGMNVIAGYSYNHSKLTRSSKALEGRRPASAGPDELINIWVSYVQPDGSLKGLGAGFGANHSGKYLSGNSATTGVFTFPSYTLLNGTLFYEMRRCRIGIKGDNLTDVLYFTGQGVLSAQMRRSLSANVTFKF
ncbi:ferrichrome-iron receptor [Pedobacter sp. BAL39]|uniref:TonB-dependent receptor n=1 Tax=Pedobacter sp. BAL39 TaxID=391596 RepID=UPI000155990A|nr:TonB-dependent receptor [Pedobacter sp. BAL39]EDM36954.1 ferrichrome-iron receptor [Pedobacter sp. BAL39]